MALRRVTPGCKFCGTLVPKGRIELGYDYCLPCSEQRPELSKAEYIVMGQHKGQPLVFAPNDPIIRRRDNTMDRG